MSEAPVPTAADAPATPRLGRLRPHNVVIDVAGAHSLGDFRWTIVADPEDNEFCVTIR